jgi:hypothetical protein
VLFACLLDCNLISDRAVTNYIAFDDHLASAQQIGIGAVAYAITAVTR